MHVWGENTEPRLAVTHRLVAVTAQPELLNTVRAVAESLDFTVMAARTFGEFRTLMTRVPTLVVLDLGRPDTHALHVIRYLQARRSATGLILLAGLDPGVWHTVEDLVTRRSLRLHAVIRKPLDPSLLERELVVLRLEMLVDAEDLDRAISSNEFEVHYQPVVNLHDREAWPVVSFEALARWTHPALGEIPPAYFIPLAEQYGRIIELTRVVIERALADFRGLLRETPGVSLSFNISPLVLHDNGLPEALLEAVRHHGIEPGRIQLEISENGAFSGQMITVRTLERLRGHGFHLLIDDFSTGNASMDQLYRMPFSQLKIDRQLVRMLNDNDEARLIVELLVDLSQRLGYSVCAKGAERRSNLELLRAAGCNSAQGYYFSRPLPFRQVETVVAGNGNRIRDPASGFPGTGGPH